MAEYSIHHDLDIVAGRRVTMEIDAARRLEDHFHLHQPLDHVAQIGHELGVRISQRVHPQLPKLVDGLAYPVLSHQYRHVPDRFLGSVVQYPHIVERDHLVRQRPPRRVLVDGVVLPLRVERRVKVNQVHAPLRQVLHDREAIAKVQAVHTLTAPARKPKKLSRRSALRWLYFQAASAT